MGAIILAFSSQGQGLISQRRGNASHFYHHDGLGSTKALTDANQNTQASYKYDAWGNILQASGTITNPYLYVGELSYYGDGDPGMYLLTQRWYNPVVGRFVVRDPLRRLSLYDFVLNNPLSMVDPSGLLECSPWRPIGSLEWVLRSRSAHQIGWYLDFVVFFSLPRGRCGCCWRPVWSVAEIYDIFGREWRTCWQPNRRCPQKTWKEFRKTKIGVGHRYISSPVTPAHTYSGEPIGFRSCPGGQMVYAQVNPWAYDPDSPAACMCFPPGRWILPTSSL